MSMINLNDDSIKVGESVGVFNNGEAGIIENVTFDRIEPRAKDASESHPDFKLYFKDSSDNELSFGIYVIDPSRNEWAPKKLKSQQVFLKHLAHAIIAPDYEFPLFENPKAMLSGVLLAIREYLTPENKFRVYTNFGTTFSSNGFLKLRSFAPCIESMEVPLENTVLKASSIEVLTKPEADVTSNSSSSTVDTDW